jgi:hypothetical protein
MKREDSLESFTSVPGSITTPHSTHRNHSRSLSPMARSLSPARSLSYCDYESNPDPIYRQGMKKIAEGCARFSKERDGMLLTVRPHLRFYPLFSSHLSARCLYSSVRLSKAQQWIVMFLKKCYVVD